MWCHRSTWWKIIGHALDLLLHFCFFPPLKQVLFTKLVLLCLSVLASNEKIL
ncbi:hypothetical protein Hanom_Chr04g00292961 [Helianthus anomalus]